MGRALLESAGSLCRLREAVVTSTVVLREIRVQILMGEDEPYLNIDGDEHIAAWEAVGMLTMATDFIRSQANAGWEDE